MRFKPMKCLSVCQPFAELLISGKKTIELRSWNTKYRGMFLVHAPIRIRLKDCKRLKIFKNLPTGAIVGKADLEDVKVYRTKKELIHDSEKHLAELEFNNKIYGFIIKNPKRFRIPIPTKGNLGFFEVNLPKIKFKKSELKSEIIDEEYRYQWIGHH